MKVKFIDLFSGLGGFHVALSKCGHKCVFSSEINKTLAQLYEKNFGIKTAGDISKIPAEDIPPHDILCAGFPCQPFSKAGNQKGLKDKRNGSYFINDVARILEYHKPKYFILENVHHLIKHDREKTWNIIHKKLVELGYEVKQKVLSPYDFGIPQIRKRVFIVGSLNGLKDFNFPETQIDPKLTIKKILDKKNTKHKYLSEKQENCLSLWQRIIEKIPIEDPLPSFPIWSMEFGATYPFEKKTPFVSTKEELQKTKGIFGKKLDKLDIKKINTYLPSYSKTTDKKFPDWKIRYIRNNREFYEKYKKDLKPFLKELKLLPPSWQKLEWNCQNEKRFIKNYILQFRASGLRVKRINHAPTLVVTTTQRPIIGWENRYLSLSEAARLQSLQGIVLPENETTAFRALGNAVNSEIVYLIAKKLIK